MFASKDLFFTKPSGAGYQISRSVRTRSSASAYFNRTLTTPTNNKIWTYSVWVKKARPTSNYDSLFSISDSKVFRFGYSGSDFILNFIDTNTGWYFTTTQVFRDPSAWMHLVLVIDTTNATAGNRTKVYVNGIQVTAFSAKTDPSQNAASSFNAAVVHYIGQAPASGHYFDGYMTEVNFIDGQALTPSSFGETNAVTGVWQPIKYTGTYGTNGFYLNFSDNSNNTAATIGKDYSGNGNNWTPNNISVTTGVTYDSMLDVPTPYADGGNGRGNYAVMNPLKTGGITASNANLTVTGSASNTSTIVGTIGVSSGKWYWEFTVGSTDQNSMIGICTDAVTLTNYIGSDANGWGYYGVNGNKYNNATPVAYGASYTNGDVIGVALDADAGTLTFYKNNTSQGTAYSSLASNVYFPAYGDTGTAAVPTGSFNFGQRPFSYTPPTGFVALNTQNLPTPTISNGANYMAATTYTGTGATQTIANSGNNAGAISFQPDFVWIKSRSAATNNNLFDSVRGATNYLISNSTAAQATNANSLTAFGTTGFTLGSDAGAIGVNVNAATYVAWQWKASGSTVSNTSGTITSTVSAGATQGFSVVTYSGNSVAGATVGHGLGVKPSLMILFNRSVVGEHPVYSSVIGASNYLYIQATNASAAFSGFFNNTEPTSTVFSIGSDSRVNGSGNSLVAYCFSAVAGYSAFGSYTGNGSADGPFVYLGFRPRFLMMKRYSAGTANWYIFDSSRSTYNAIDVGIYPNLANAETALGASTYDFLSNGFKLRQTNADFNESGIGYIYAAFAENPFKNSLAR